MNLQQKEHIVLSLKNNLQTNATSFVIGYRGLTVSQFNSLRRKIKKHGGDVSVVKKTLIKRALDHMKNRDDFIASLKDQVALIFAKNESSNIAKILCEFAKEYESCKILSGYFQETILTPQTIKILATLPSREILLAQLLGVLKRPIIQVPYTLNMALLRLLFVLKQISNKKVS